MKVVWTHQAYLRLSEIHEFIARDSQEAADRWAGKILDRGDGLADFPEKGRAVPELPGSSLRELIEGNYRIVYRVTKRKIELLTVFEGHMGLPAKDLPDVPTAGT